MKISPRKKNERQRFFRKSQKCVECGKSVEDGYHFVPAERLWICTGRRIRTTIADLCKCSLRERLVGDGCDVCNPELAADLAKEQKEGA